MDDKKKIQASSLPTDNGKIYHLRLASNELADNVIIVGDPERVPMIAKKFLARVEMIRDHRGLRTITGVTEEGGVRISVVTSGMGTPSLEIVMNELLALREIDLSKLEPIPSKPSPLNVIRVGTSGALRSDTELGTSVIAAYALGLDNSGFYVDFPASDSASLEIEKRTILELRKNSVPGSRFGDRLDCYVARAHPMILDAMVRAAEKSGVSHKVGITVSAAGFFANQGRKLVDRVRLTVPDVDEVISKIDLSDIKELQPPDIHFENMEMEASALFHLGAAMGYRVGCVCTTVAQRRLGTFLMDSEKEVENSSLIAIRTFIDLSKT